MIQYSFISIYNSLIISIRIADLNCTAIESFLRCSGLISILDACVFLFPTTINRNLSFPTLYFSQGAQQTNKRIQTLVNTLGWPPKLNDKTLLKRCHIKITHARNDQTGTETAEPFLQASFNITESIFRLMGEGTYPILILLSLLMIFKINCQPKCSYLDNNGQVVGLKGNMSS